MDQQSRSFIFLNSEDPVSIKLPFPPTINPRDLINFSKGSIPSRAPNPFIIYRKLFFLAAKDKGYSLPMTIISTLASKSWEQEPEIVKSEYRRIAKEASDYRNEMLPNKKREEKKKHWSIISFDEPKPIKLKDHVHQVNMPMASPEFISNSVSTSSDLNILNQYNSPEVNVMNEMYKTNEIKNGENNILNQIQPGSEIEMPNCYITSEPITNQGLSNLNVNNSIGKELSSKKAYYFF